MGGGDVARSVVAATLLGGAVGMVKGLDGAQLLMLCCLIWMVIYVGHAVRRAARRWIRGRL